MSPEARQLHSIFGASFEKPTKCSSYRASFDRVPRYISYIDSRGCVVGDRCPREGPAQLFLFSSLPCLRPRNARDDEGQAPTFGRIACASVRVCLAIACASELDDQVAILHLSAHGTELNVFTREHAVSRGAKVESPLPAHCLYSGTIRPTGVKVEGPVRDLH